MKRIILTVLMITCCMFCFAGCDGLSETYWKDTHKTATSIFGSDSSDFASVYNISYSDEVSTIIASYGNEYAELKEVFEPLFESAISYAYVHYEDLQVSPKNNNDSFKNAIKNVNNSLASLKSELTKFIHEKEVFETWFESANQTEATEINNKSRLLLFKREYISLIEKAYNLSSDLFNARKLGYYNFSNYSDKDLQLIDPNADCDLAVSASNLEILSTAIKIVRAYNAKEVASEYDNYWGAAKDYYSDFVKSFGEGLLVPREMVKNDLKNWMNVYNMFKSEKARLFEVLGEIDLKVLVDCDNNADRYAEEKNNQDVKIYAEYYLNFYKNIEILNTYTRNLFN